MNAKKYLYAAVGAQVAVAKSAQTKLEEMMSKVNENASTASSDMKGRIDVWAGEGEKFLSQVTDTKAIDELTSKVDFDQMQSQVNKLRDQLEDIVATWRANFRPETSRPEKVAVTEASPEAVKTVGATAGSAAAPAEKTSAKKPAAKASTTKASTTKATATKATATKKPAAKKPATKATAAKSATSRTSSQKAS